MSSSPSALRTKSVHFAAAASSLAEWIAEGVGDGSADVQAVRAIAEATKATIRTFTLITLREM